MTQTCMVSCEKLSEDEAGFATEAPVHRLQNVWHKQAATCENEKSHRSSALCPAEVPTSTQPLAFTRASIYRCLPPRGTLPPG